MKYLGKKKLNNFLLLGVFILIVSLVFTGCTGGENNENEGETGIEENEPNNNENVPTEEEEPKEEVKVLKGTIKDGTMETITVLGEDENEYSFITEDIEVKTGESGLLIGNPVTVEYVGELDETTNAQEVEIVSITVEDQKNE